MVKKKIAKKTTKAAKKTVKKKEAKKAVSEVVKKKSELNLLQSEEAKAEINVKADIEQQPDQVEEKVSAPEPVIKKKAQPKESEVFYGATGRRKTSVARVKLIPGSGKIFVNKVLLNDYISGRRVLVDLVTKPLIITETNEKYDVLASVNGGGVVGQAGAISHGIARALVEVNPDFRLKLKPEGFLTRDPRMKERKKFGRKKARKSFQFSKR